VGFFSGGKKKKNTTEPKLTTRTKFLFTLPSLLTTTVSGNKVFWRHDLVCNLN